MGDQIQNIFYKVCESKSKKKSVQINECIFMNAEELQRILDESSVQKSKLINLQTKLNSQEKIHQKQK